MVPGDRTAGDTEARARGDEHPASEAVAAIAARGTLATESQIVADRRGTDTGGPCQDGKPAAPAGAAAAAAAISAGAAEGLVVVQRAAAKAKGRNIREAIEAAGAELDATAQAGPPGACRATGTADGLVVGDYGVGYGHGRIERDRDAAA